MSDPTTSPAVTYGTYLRIDDLLSLQQPRSSGPEHDELLFIVIHQVYELWFKELLHELDHVAQLLTEDEPHRAQHTLKRILTILKVMVAQLDILETMTPLEFQSFRQRLEAASGFQSDQFRQIEFMLGVKGEASIARFAEGTRARAALEKRYGEPTLWDAFLHFLAREGYAVPPAHLARDVAAPVEASAEIQRVLIEVYRKNPKNAELCERLVDLDEGVQEWRYRHVKMVERTIGAKRGTGGSSGAAYLRATVGRNIFPDLWEIPDAAVNALAAHYSRFRVADRILLTGHSHQAWPDVTFEAQQRAWLDAAEFVDDKWDKAEERAARVREGFARLLDEAQANIALGQNTHELVTRWLSALPLRQRPRIVTTDGEFHSLRRQVDRLGEDGALTVVRVAARPVDTLAERLALSVDDRTACVIVSSVLYETAEIVPDLDRLASVCDVRGAALLVDAYHHLNVVPFDLTLMGLADAFVVGGGYKYCQLGEGNCFLRVPPGRNMRPVLTGWFAEFAALDASHEDRRVKYGPGASAFGGATYDPTSHYRAAAVFDFHLQQGLTPARLRAISRHQVTLLESLFEQLDLNEALARVVPVPDGMRAGFLAIRSPHAGELSRALRERGVFTDARGEILRLGPAPYLDDRQLHDGVAALGEIVRNDRT